MVREPPQSLRRRGTIDGRRNHLCDPCHRESYAVRFHGQGRDRFFPGIAVDRRGRVGVCYYNRRQRPDNSRIDRYCSTSENAGSSWDEEQASQFGWIPAHATDGVINPVYIGDYDSVSSDFLLQQNGFISSFESAI